MRRDGSVFKVAHELSHTLLDEARAASSGHVDAAVGAFDEARREEFLCDIGAAQLLLHPRWLRDLAGDREPSLDCLFEVASTCEASLEATARQVAVLGVWACSFVLWEPGYRKGERAALGSAPLSGFEAAAAPGPKLRAIRPYAAPGQPFFPLRKSVDAGSSIARALATHERTRGRKRFAVGAGLMAECESQYVGYVDGDGREVPRVLTLLRWLPPR
ncbi:MAG: ImmA/IrrE family metallo-endopeptidase [Chloroflexi bacterium]|nr:ImmA/IrrE family metallo-endopeptidase [Chloroflexota bacterium]